MISIQGVSFASFRQAVQKKTRKNARCHSSSAAPFSKLLLNRVESRKVFNMSKLRLIHSFSTVYYTPRSDKQSKNQSENSTKKTLRAVFSDAKFTSLYCSARRQEDAVHLRSACSAEVVCRIVILLILYIYIYIYIYVCVCVYVYIYIYIYTDGLFC